MKIDLYTKTILTMIAISLAIIAGRGFVPVAHAQMIGPVHVILDSVDEFAFQYTTVPVKVQQ